MKSSPEHLLDACLTQLNNGEDLEQILARFPEHADELRPMLVAAAWVAMDVPPPQRRIERKQAFMDAVSQRRRMVESTDGYVVELKAGVPIQELLDRATPAMRPLIAAASQMLATEHPEPARERMLAGKLHLMAMVKAHQRAKRRAAAPQMVQMWHRAMDGLLEGLTGGTSLTRRAWSGAVAMVMVGAVVVGGLTGVTHVAASSLPGQPLYNVKRLTESAQLFLTLDHNRRRDLEQQFGAQRFDEIRDLVRDGKSVPTGSVLDWLRSSAHVMADVNGLPVAEQLKLAQALKDAKLDTGTASIAELDELLAWTSRLAAPAESQTPAGTSVPGYARIDDYLPAEPHVLQSQPVELTASEQESSSAKPILVAPAPMPIPQAMDALDAKAPMSLPNDNDEDAARAKHRKPGPSTGGPGNQPPADATTETPPMIIPGDELVPTPSPADPIIQPEPGDAKIEPPAETPLPPPSIEPPLTEVTS